MQKCKPSTCNGHATYTCSLQPQKFRAPLASFVVTRRNGLPCLIPRLKSTWLTLIASNPLIFASSSRLQPYRGGNDQICPSGSYAFLHHFSDMTYYSLRHDYDLLSVPCQVSSAGCSRAAECVQFYLLHYIHIKIQTVGGFRKTGIQ